jgi:hypothetical protein
MFSSICWYSPSLDSQILQVCYLIHDIKDLFHQDGHIHIVQPLEHDIVAKTLAKLDASSNIDIMANPSPPSSLMDLLSSNFKQTWFEILIFSPPKPIKFDWIM